MDCESALLAQVLQVKRTWQQLSLVLLRAQVGYRCHAQRAVRDEEGAQPAVNTCHLCDRKPKRRRRQACSAGGEGAGQASRQGSC